MELELKRQFLIETLTDRNVFKTQTGNSIYEANYEELKYELVLQTFRDIDVESDSNKWF